MLRCFFLACLLAAGPLKAGSAPDFTLKKADGSVFRLKEHLGKQVVLVDFWATWCGPCTRALKELQKLRVSHPEVLVLAASIDDGQSLARVDEFTKGRGYTFTVLLDSGSNVLRLFNPAGSVPTTVVIDLKGEVVYTHHGFVPGDEKALGDLLDRLKP